MFIAGHQCRKPVEMSLCHPDRIVKARGMCGSCYNAWLDNRDPAKKETILARRREYWAEMYVKGDKVEIASKRRNRILKHRYGISSAEYEARFQEQGGLCAICKTPASDIKATRLYVDHNHATGDVRKLICPGCNSSVAVIEQGAERISALAAYLAEHETDKHKAAIWNSLARLDARESS
jgi:hypothetical protein